MHFILTSKTLAALMGTALLLAWSPNNVSARIVGPSGHRVQVTEGSTLGDVESCEDLCIKELMRNFDSNKYKVCVLDCEDPTISGATVKAILAPIE